MFSNKLLFSSIDPIDAKLYEIKTPQFKQIYLNLITEWIKSLYTPKILLDLVVEQVFTGIKCNQLEFVLGLTFYDLIHLNKNNNYQYYSEFNECLQMFQHKFKKDNDILNHFSIQICVCNCKKIQSIQSALSQTTYYPYFKQIYEQCKNEEFPSSQIFKWKYYEEEDIPCFTFAKGCLIIINTGSITKSNLYSKNYLEKLLDHQLNHYFNLLNKKLKVYKEVYPSEIFKQIIIEAGYCYDSDLLKHLFSNSEYTSMCSDVCNSIDFYLKELYPNVSNSELYYYWIDMSSQKFLVSFKFQQLNEEFQKSLLFSFACRYFDKERWNDLKEHVKVQLNNPSVNFLKASINWLKELFHKV